MRPSTSTFLMATPAAKAGTDSHRPHSPHTNRHRNSRFSPRFANISTFEVGSDRGSRKPSAAHSITNGTPGDCRNYYDTTAAAAVLYHVPHGAGNGEDSHRTQIRSVRNDDTTFSSGDRRVRRGGPARPDGSGAGVSLRPVQRRQDGPAENGLAADGRGTGLRLESRTRPPAGPGDQPTQADLVAGGSVRGVLGRHELAGHPREPGQGRAGQPRPHRCPAGRRQHHDAVGPGVDAALSGVEDREHRHRRRQDAKRPLAVGPRRRGGPGAARRGAADRQQQHVLHAGNGH